MTDIIIVISPELTPTAPPPHLHSALSTLPTLAASSPAVLPFVAPHKSPPLPAQSSSTSADVEYNTQGSSFTSSPPLPFSPSSPSPTVSPPTANGGASHQDDQVRRTRVEPSASTAAIPSSFPSSSLAPSPPSAPPTGLMCVRPDWVQHGGAPVYSCHIDPLNQRLVTAGADHKLRVWALPPLLSVDAEMASGPRLLATLGNHLNPVNCVRFAPAGRLMASCSDGRAPAIMLWRLHEEGDESFHSSRPFGTDEEEDVDRWALHAQLLGHSADILDLAFSPDGHLLASASVDNDVIVWDVRSCEARRKLRGHRGWVKGVSWDPTGRYVASMGDDQQLIVWDSADDWRVRRAITESLVGGGEAEDAEGGGRTLVGRIGLNEKMKQIAFSRLSWTADGSALGVSKGYDGQGKLSVSPVFTRGTWTRWCAYVGHKHPTTVTQFNPRMFTRQPPAPSSVAPSPAHPTSAQKAAATTTAIRRSARAHASTHSLDTSSQLPAFYPIYTVCAVGSLDNSISVWVTSSADVLARFELFFTQAVVDLAWSSDGYSLLACSHDGSVAFFRFTEEEFGRCLSDEEMRTHMRRTYGDEAGAGMGGVSDAVDGVLGMEIEEMGREYAERLRTAREETADDGPPGAVVRRASSAAKVTTEEVMAKQREVKRVDAKGRTRRVVTPLHVQGGTVYSSTASPPVVVPLPPVPTFPASATGSGSAPAFSAAHSSQLHGGELAHPPPTSSSSSLDVSSKRKRDADGTPSSHKKKKKHTAPAVDHALAAPSSIAPPVAPPPPAASRPGQVVPSSTAPSSSPAVAPSAQVRVMAPPPSRHVIPPAPMQRQLLCKLPASSQSLLAVSSLPTSSEGVIESLPPPPAPRHAAASKAARPRVFTSLLCRRGGVEQWQTPLPGHCTLIVASPVCVAACCREHVNDDSAGSLHILSLTGRRLLPPIHLSAPPSHLSMSSPASMSFQPPHLLVLTSTAQLLLFSTSPYACTLDVSIASLLSSSAFSAARVLHDGRLLVMTADGKCWMRDEVVRAWLDVGDADWVGSSFQSRLSPWAVGDRVDDGEEAEKSLQAIQSEAKQSTTSSSSSSSSFSFSSLLSLDARSRTLHTIAHLEVRVPVTVATPSL